MVSYGLSQKRISLVAVRVWNCMSLTAEIVCRSGSGTAGLGTTQSRRRNSTTGHHFKAASDVLFLFFIIF